MSLIGLHWPFFHIDPPTGVLALSTAPDFEGAHDADADNGYGVRVQLSDGAGGITTLPFNGLRISDLGGDDELRPILGVTINSQGGFVDNGTGTQQGIDPEDIFFAEDYIYVHVGGESRFDAARLVLDVQFANVAPDLGDPTRIVDPFPEGILRVLEINASDADVIYGETLAFSIVGGDDAALFEINSASGLLSFISAPDYEAPGDVGTLTNWLMDGGQWTGAGFGCVESTAWQVAPGSLGRFAWIVAAAASRPSQAPQPSARSWLAATMPAMSSRLQHLPADSHDG